MLAYLAIWGWIPWFRGSDEPVVVCTSLLCQENGVT